MADTSKIKEIAEKLEQGVKDVFDSDKFTEYLKTMSRFHSYSTRNTLLIHMQRPGATQVASYRGWQSKFNRHVKKGEKGIKIIVPVPVVRKEEKEKLDPETKRPVIGEDGMPVMEQIEERFVAKFRVGHVYDESQTEGEPLPSLVSDLAGDVEQYTAFMDALKAVSPLPIVIEPMPEDTDGYCRFGEQIGIRTGMSQKQTVCAVIHEMTHDTLHDKDRLVQEDENFKPKDSKTKEIEAEGVSYAVCQYFGIETSANSFGYLAEWSDGREVKELNASLDTIRKTAAELIDAIDEKFQAIVKERGIDLSQQTAGQTVLETPSAETDNSVFMNTFTQYAEGLVQRTVGKNVLMPPVFADHNFNHDGKKIRVTVEEPIGKYQIFSREEFEKKEHYFLTASGMIDRTSQYFRDVWNEETHKWENHLPTEAELDEIVAKVAERFEQDLADPAKFSLYQHAAVVNRLDECEKHNIPVRKAKDERQKQRSAEAEVKRQEEARQKQEKYDNRIDEIAKAIETGRSIAVPYKEYAFDGKNPVLDLFRLYDIKLPLRTQGWVNTGLAEITGNTYRYYKSKHKGDSTTFFGYLKTLHQEIQAMPIEQKRQPQLPAETAENEKPSYPAPTPPPYSKTNTPPHKLYRRFAELFPRMFSGEIRYLRLESDGFEPLSIEWIGRDRISIMHTYTLNGDLCYDPMMTFEINKEAKTLTAVEFQQSIPPVYQRIEDGVGLSVDGNGRQSSIPDLQRKLNDFAIQWFENISEQGYMPVRGAAEIDGEEMRITFDKDGTPIVSKPETPESQKPEAATLDLSLPDPTVSAADLNAYGYTEPDMHPLSVDRAVELFDTDHTIYLLYPDNTEAIALDRDEIITFSSDGFCGITYADWEVSPVRSAQLAIVANAEGRREAELLHSMDHRFGIYQVRDGEELRNVRFSSMEELENQNLTVNRANYELVYTAPIPEDIESMSDKLPLLNSIFQKFNTDRPEDYTGRSVSMSDVIVLKSGGDLTSHYVDRVGFAELQSFLGEEKRQPLKIADPSPPTSSQIETKPPEQTQRPVSSKKRPRLEEQMAQARKLMEQQDKSNSQRVTERGGLG